MIDLTHSVSLALDRLVCLGHVYIVLEPVGSARLKLDDGYIMSLCVLMYRRSSESRMISGT